MRRQRLIRRRDQHVGRDALLDPSLQREDRIVLGVERYGSTPDCPKLTAPAPPRQWFIPGTMKSRSNCSNALQPAIGGDDAIEVVDRSLRKDELVGPAVIGDHLAAVSAEAGGFGSSVPITAWSFSCDCRKPVSKLRVVSVCQSKVRFCSIQRRQ